MTEPILCCRKTMQVLIIRLLPAKFRTEQYEVASYAPVMLHRLPTKVQCGTLHSGIRHYQMTNFI